MTIKLRNAWNRNFNGIWPGETINVAEEVKNTYIVAGFVEIKEGKEETSDEVEKTKADLVEEAKELGLEFPKNIGKAKLQVLIDEAKEETSDEEK